MCQVCKKIWFAPAGRLIFKSCIHHYCTVYWTLIWWISLQVTGGGGYTKENVARCWTVETGVLLDTELPNGICFFFKVVHV